MSGDVWWCVNRVWWCLMKCLVAFGGVLCISSGVLGCLVHVSCRTYQDRPEKTNITDLILELAF